MNTLTEDELDDHMHEIMGKITIILKENIGHKADFINTWCMQNCTEAELKRPEKQLKWKSRKIHNIGTNRQRQRSRNIT